MSPDPPTLKPLSLRLGCLELVSQGLGFGVFGFKLYATCKIGAFSD